MIGTAHPELAGAAVSADSSSICCRSRRVSSTPGRSALLIANTSATSIRPALAACTLSPQPGLTTTTVVSALPATSTSTCPTPTVSTTIQRWPDASSRRIASGVASDRPPRWPRVAIDRMNTPGSVAWSCMRTRSPRIAPPVNGDDGSTASTATSSPSAAEVRDQRRRERALAGTRRAGQADRVGVAGPWRGEPSDLARRVAAALDEREQPGLGAAVALPRGGEEVARRPRRHASSAASSAMSTTSVTPSTRSRMIRSMPAFNVCVDAGHPTHAPSARPSRHPSPRRRRAA